MSLANVLSKDLFDVKIRFTLDIFLT